MLDSLAYGSEAALGDPAEEVFNSNLQQNSKEG